MIILLSEAFYFKEEERTHRLFRKLTLCDYTGTLQFQLRDCLQTLHMRSQEWSTYI